MRRLMLLSVAALISLLTVVGRTDKASGTARFSDREVFEGVVFGAGPVASLVPEARDQLRPEIYARSADELAAMAAIRAELIAAIDRAQPGLVGEFARVARSGDPAAIRTMLERATQAVNAAAAAEQNGTGDGTLFANVPQPVGPMRPVPPRPKLQQDEQLFANVPQPVGPMRPVPTRPAPTFTSPQLAAEPAWALFSSQLFTEQLAASIAVKLERSAPTEG